MQSKATTVEQYLAELPKDRREALQAIRQTICENLPAGYEEGMLYGMIGYFVPHRLYPPGYHCDPSQPLSFVSLASQKNHLAIYIMCGDEFDAWFREAWTKSGKKLDMGKSCVRFKKIEDVPLKVVGRAVKRVPVKKLVEYYESVKPRGATSSKAAKKTLTKPSTRRSATKKKKK